MESAALWKLKTIDIDTQDGVLDMDFVHEAIVFISHCRYARWTMRRSTHGGVHIVIHCYSPVDCDLCRERYDDPVRYSKDKHRPVYGRNVLFEEKRKVRGWGARTR